MDFTTINFIVTTILIIVNITSLFLLISRAIEVNTSNYLLLEKILTNIGLLIISCITLVFSERTWPGALLHVGICYNSFKLTQLLKRSVIRIKE